MAGGGAFGAMGRTKKVLTSPEAKAMALRDGVEQVVLTQDVDDMQRVANERKEARRLFIAFFHLGLHVSFFADFLDHIELCVESITLVL